MRFIQSFPRPLLASQRLPSSLLLLFGSWGKMKLLGLVVLPLVGARAVHTPQQIPIVADLGKVGPDMTASVLEHTSEEAPMVGVHFTTSYAIASVRYQNGTLRDLGKIDGDAEYVETMSRWAQGKDDVTRDW